MAYSVYPNSSALAISEQIRTAQQAGKIKLWQAGLLTPNPGTTIEECDAAECDFSGYAEQVFNLLQSYLPTGGGAGFDMATELFLATADTPFVDNMVGGFWIESAAGVLYLIGTFDDPIPIAKAGDAVPVSVTQIFCRPPG